MPVVNIEIDKNAKITMDYEGYQGQECEMAEANIKEKIKNLRMTTTNEAPKYFEDRKLQIDK